MTYLAISIYTMAIILANLLVAKFGPSISPINAFFLIGLDLALRNWLALRMQTWQMALMIVGTGLASYLINPATGLIAIASGVAFTAAALVDWLAFNTAVGSWARRNFVGNTSGALVDSLLFPTIAFGALMPEIVALQFVAKILGGTLWGQLISRMGMPKVASV